MLRRGLTGRLLFAKPPGPIIGICCVATALALPTLLKLALDASLVNVPPFLTFFPAVTIAALCMGLRWGALVLLGSVLICDYLFIAPYGSWSLTLNDGIIVLLFLLGAGLIVIAADSLRRAAQALRRAAVREQEMNAELRHRVNNNLAVLQAMASQIARENPESQAYYVTFRERLLVLREAHDILSSTEWETCDLPRLAERGLRPFEHHNAVTYSGPSCTLRPESCVALTLALHELGRTR